MCRPAEASCRDHHGEHRPYDPLPLLPTHPLAPAKRVPRYVQTTGHKLSSRVVLQPMPAALGTPCYAFDPDLAQPSKGNNSLFFATPLASRDPSSSPPLKQCGPPVVVKMIPTSHSHKKRRACPDSAINEVAAMQHLMKHYRITKDHRYPHILPLLDCMQDHDFIYLVMPYLSGGDLFSRVKAVGSKGLSVGEASRYLRHITEGLLFMKRSCNLAHCDVSLENVMLCSRGNAYVIDFGMAVRVPKLAPLAEEDEDEETKDECGCDGGGDQPIYLAPQRCRGKLGYLAPEMVCEEPFDPFAADVWSLGVCLYAMLTGRRLYESPDCGSFKSLAEGRVVEVLDIYERHGLVLSPLAKDLVCRMLQADPTKRPTLEEVLAHPFIQDLRDHSAKKVELDGEGSKAARGEEKASADKAAEALSLQELDLGFEPINCCTIS